MFFRLSMSFNKVSFTQPEIPPPPCYMFLRCECRSSCRSRCGRGRKSASFNNCMVCEVFANILSLGFNLRWLRRNAQGSEQSCQNGEALPIQVYRDRNLFVQKLSKPACLHRRGAREKSGILNINIRIFLSRPEERVQLNTFSKKKVGVTGHFEICFFFQKNRFFQ